MNLTPKCPCERLLARYNAGGPQALGDLRRRNGASSSVLKPDLLEKLKARLLEPPPDGGWWTSPKGAARRGGVRGPGGGGRGGGRAGARGGLAARGRGGPEGDRLVGAEAPPPPSCLG